MSAQEIIIKLPDSEGNPIGVIKLNELHEHEHKSTDFSVYMNNSKICFKNVPDVPKLDNHTPLLFLDSKNIFLLEETEYQLIFTPEKSNSNTVRFPTLENVGNDPVLKPLMFDMNIYGGILNFKSYVGQSFFDVEVDGLKSVKIPFEVRSKKMNYENHYPSMIADLAKAASGLIFYEKSPTFKYINFQQRVKKSFYEDFMFLEYIFRPENLLSSYGYIRRDPHKILEQYFETVPTAFASSIGPTDLINLISNPGNLSKTDVTPPKWPLEMENYVPKRISQKNYEDTLDTPENRFVKYFLELLNELLIEMIIYIDFERIEGYPAEKTREYAEIIQEYIFDGWLNEVGVLYNLPSNSQVLQKKEGYRDILDYFLIFEFAFNFQCEEIKEDIKGFQQKLSQLYEYWCYLKLIKILNKLQNTKTNYESIFNFNRKEWSIQIKRSKESSQKFIIDNTDLELELAYNNTFTSKDPENHSYSLKMVPDYSLTITNNSKQYLLHFDAKYKCDIKTSFINDDIYKMHTYKDAIANTLGAYVLYPGRIPKIYQEYTNKIIPSVGAFPLTPGKSVNDEERLGKFIENVIKQISEEKN
jgi:predicted component of viral defense system (DUF524 family)